MKTLLAIAAVCCVAVSSAFPLYGSRSVPIVKGAMFIVQLLNVIHVRHAETSLQRGQIYQHIYAGCTLNVFLYTIPAISHLQRNKTSKITKERKDTFACMGRPIDTGGGHAFCPTHGRFHMGFDHGLHADRFQQLGLVGYYGDYQNLRQDGGLLGPSMGYFGNDNYNNDQGFDDFNGGFNNLNNGIIGNDEVALGIGPFRRRSFPTGPFGGDFGGDDFSNDDFSRGIGRDDFPRGPESRVRSLRPVGGLPLSPIEQAQFPTRGGGIQGGIIPRNDFDNGGFINNDLSLIHDQINH